MSDKRICIFCRRRGRPVTKEHVYPDWLASYFDDTAKGVVEVSTDEGNRIWTSALFQHTANFFCEDCNTGWMSDLENQNKETLGPMMREGRVTRLTMEKQYDLSKWVTKTILTTSLATGSTRKIIPDGYFQKFYHTQKPLGETVIYIGYRQHLTDEKKLLAASRINQIKNIQVNPQAAADVDRQASSGAVAFVATLVIGHVVFQLMGHNLRNKHLLFEAPKEFALPLHPFDHEFSFPATMPIELVGGLEGLLKDLE